MTDYTHQIVRIERSVTKGSSSPMWKCLTADGQTVNVFRHALPERDTFDLLVQAGYGDLIQMHLGDVQRWRHNYPIAVRLVKDGSWWKLAAVEPRPVQAHPDADQDSIPNPALYHSRAQRLCNDLLLLPSFWRSLDFETTGLLEDDEMVSVSVVSGYGEALFDTLVCPAHPEKLLRPGKYGKCASDINGITPEAVSGAMMTADALADLTEYLSGQIWVAYNAPFDVGVLERECLAYGHPLIFALGIHDAMRIFADYRGEWDPKEQQFKTVTLSKAARMLDIDPGLLHTARADALTTYELIKAMAAGKPIKDGV